MIFSSPYFIFVFLPLVLALIAVSKVKFHNSILLIASIFFYGWGSVSHTLILLVSIVINYVFGLLIHQSIDDNKAKSKRYLWIALILNLGILGYLKYFNFFMDNTNGILSILDADVIQYKKVILPIGISFFTFQAMSYIIDVYRKTTPVQRSIFDLALYVALFPQLIAGPIVRYFDVAGQLKSREINMEKASWGIQRFITGFAKKIIIANSMAYVADQIFAVPISEISTGAAWLGIVAYSLQIYFDFSGYSDMAIGLGKVFGFDFPENFNFPYIAKSIKDFWRRWHISLSSWFRDYLYIPLGGNRKGEARTLVNLMLVFLATGIWHGASWNFVIWGLFHGSFLLLERKGLDTILNYIWKPFQVSYTLLLVLIGWVFFRVEEFGDAIGFLSKMSFLGSSEGVTTYATEYLDNKTLIVFIIGILYSFRIFRKGTETVEKWFLSKHKETSYQFVFHTIKFVLCITMFTLCIMYLSASTYNPFIYFRF